MVAERRVRESELTDYLASHLDLVERGLTLVAKQVRIRDAQGADGIVDIVARDRYQNTVVIEVKCSDKVAREAAHEIFKYSEILRSQQRLAESEFRCILVSTHWHELRRAFAGYAARHHDTVGYLASGVDGGEDWEISPINPIADLEPVKLTAVHDVYLFERPDGRSVAFETVSAALSKAGAPHHVGLMLQNDLHDYLMYPYALYVVLGTAEMDGIEVPEEENLKGYALNPLESYISDNLICDTECDEIEQGSPEKLRHLLSESGGWRLTAIRRAGVFTGRRALEDDELLVQATQDLPGLTDTFYMRLSSPGRASHWRETRNLIEGALPCAVSWRTQAHLWLSEIEAKYINCDVKFGVQNPGIIRPLIDCSVDDLTESPIALIVEVTDPAGKRLTGLVAELRWNGRTKVKDMHSIVNRATGDVMLWYLFHPSPRVEAEVMHNLGLQVDVYELASTRDGLFPCYRLMEEKGSLRRLEYDNLKIRSGGSIEFEWKNSMRFIEFVRWHSDVIGQFQARMAQSIVRFPIGDA